MTEEPVVEYAGQQEALQEKMSQTDQCLTSRLPRVINMNHIMTVGYAAPGIRDELKLIKLRYNKICKSTRRGDRY